MITKRLGIAFLTLGIFTAAHAQETFISPFLPQRSFYIQSGENSSQELQETLYHLKPGDQLILEAGLYEGPFHIDTRCQEGSEELPIEIIAAKGALITAPSPERFKKLSREEKKSPLLTIERSGWRISNLEINAQNGPAAIGIRAENIAVQGCHLHDGRSSGIIIAPRSKNITIADCQIHQFIHPQTNKDAHGIMVHAGTENIQIINNTIYGNSGDSIQVVGPEQSEKNNGELFPFARNISILENTMHDDRENAVDIKSSREVTIRLNRIYSYRPSRTSDGEGVIVHYDAQGVVLAENHIDDTTIGISVSRGSIGGKRAAGFPQKITIQGNVIKNTEQKGTDGILTFDSHDVKILNNTVSGFSSPISVKGKPPRTENITVENNIVNKTADIDPTEK